MTVKPPTLLITPFLTLLARDLVRFFRYPVRVWSFFFAPLFLAAVASAGFWEGSQLNDLNTTRFSAAFFFPALVVLSVIFTALNAPSSIIEDRRDGFIQALLVSPISNGSIVSSKVVAASILALVQAGLLSLSAPLIGLHLSVPGATTLLIVLAVAGFLFASLGFLLAWLSDSAISFYWTITVVVLPSWVLGGGMALVQEKSWLAPIAVWNPVRCFLALSRSAFSPSAESAGHSLEFVRISLTSHDFLFCLVCALLLLVSGHLLLFFRVRTAI